MYQKETINDGFLNKAGRIANQSVQMLGTIKGLMEIGNLAVKGYRYIQPVASTAMALL